MKQTCQINDNQGPVVNKGIKKFTKNKTDWFWCINAYFYVQKTESAYYHSSTLFLPSLYSQLPKCIVR